MRRRTTSVRGKSKVDDCKGHKGSRWTEAQERELEEATCVHVGGDQFSIQHRGHTTGDGNCAWRAIHKALKAGHRPSGVEGSWKRLKKRVLAHMSRLPCGDDVKQLVDGMKVMGAWSNKATFIMAAGYLDADVVVDVEGVGYRFGKRERSPYNLGTESDVAVAIQNGHCVNVILGECVCRSNGVGARDSKCHGSFECAGKSTRLRTRRVTLETSFGQDLHFVPKDWSPEIIEREVAKVWGCRRNWLTWQWDNWTLAAEHSAERPVLTVPCRDRLNELTTLLEAAPLNGRRGVDPNVWTRSFGARTSRKHGITEGSFALAAEVREVNRLLRLVAPHETWLSFAVVSHHNVEWHVDRMNGEHSYVMTLNGARAYLEVETDVSCMRRAVCTSDRVVYFDATRRHRVNVTGGRYARSIVMYSPARLVPQGHFEGLIDLGFPIGADGGVYPFAEPFDVTGISPPAKRATGTDECCSERGKQARVAEGAFECDGDSSTVDYGYGNHVRDVQLSPTIPWRTPDIFEAGAGDEVKAERDELSRLIQWTKGFGSGHTAKQLRMILLAEKKTWKRLVTCKQDNDKSKAEILIAAAMKRCGMKAVENNGGEAETGAGGGKGRARSTPPGGTQEVEKGKGRSSSQPAANRKGQQEQNKGKGKGKGDGGKGSGDRDKAVTFKLIADEWPSAMPPRDNWCQDQAGVYVTENTTDVVMWAAP
eukprot:6452911-Amphidinium_carterae.1